MEREELIKKWLKGELSLKEEQVFNALAESTDLKTLSAAMQDFDPPAYSTESELQRVKLKKQSPLATPTKTINVRWASIAAILVVALGVAFFLNQNNDIVNTTGMAEMASLDLPDATNVVLNADSQITFDLTSWDEKRSTKLEGEAFFKVTKGSKFTVVTPAGEVIVLGTQFNVKQRGGFFKVHCYEGSVKVVHNSEEVILKPGEYVSFFNNVFKFGVAPLETYPSWTKGVITFKSEPYSVVLEELERQFAVKVETQNVTIPQLFTGQFSNKNLEEALKTITWPLQLTYTIKDKTVSISSE